MPTTEELNALRREYTQRALDESSVSDDPFEQFRVWFGEISKVSAAEVNAMALATADKSGFPSVRMVLLKGFDPLGFHFYTNYQSRKGEELAANPRASLLFYWSELERQVRIEGTVERLSRAENVSYFTSRPEGARLGALASDQSRPLRSRSALEERLAAVAKEFSGKEIPCPEQWGGYRLQPSRFEFWQGRESRLHDRVSYEQSLQNRWIISRLYP